MNTEEGVSPLLSRLVVAPAVGAVAFALTVVVLAFNGTTIDLPHILRTPRVTVWCLLIAAQVSLWVLILPAGYAGIRRRWELLKRHRNAIGGLLIGLLLLFVIFLAGAGHRPAGTVYPLTNHDAKIVAITAVGFVALLMVLVAMHLVALEATEIGDDVSVYVRLKEELRTYLTLTAVIVASATLSTGTLQETLATLNPWPPHASDRGYLLTLMYGGFACGFVLLVYVPALLNLRRAGRTLRDGLVPAPSAVSSGETGVEAWKRWAEDRAVIGRLIGLESNSVELLKDAMAVSAPLVGSAVALLARIH